MINRSIQIIILALFVAFPAFAQEPQTKKFRPAGPDAKNPRPDEWCVSFVESLSVEECDREIDRILSQYGIKLMTRGPDDPRPFRYPERGSIAIHASEEQAKQISEDEAILQVTQNADLKIIIGPTLQEFLRTAPPEYRNQPPLPGKRAKPGKVQNKTERKDKP